GNAYDRQAIDRPQLVRHLTRRSRHPGQPEVAAEETLIADASQGLVARAELTAFLDLDELMQALLPRAVRHEPPRVLVHDLHLAALEERARVGVEEVTGHEGLARELLAPEPAHPQAAQGLDELGQPRHAARAQAQDALGRLDGEVTVEDQLVGEAQGRVV